MDLPNDLPQPLRDLIEAGPQSIRDQIEAIELGVQSIVDGFQQDQNHYLHLARKKQEEAVFPWEVDPLLTELVVSSGVQGRQEASRFRFDRYAGQIWKLLNQDIDAFMGALDLLSRWAMNGEIPAGIRRDWRIWALRERVKAGTEKPKPASEPASEPDAAHAPPFPKRGAWAQEQLDKRGLKKSHLVDHGGPEHHTVQRILDGKKVHPDSLKAFVNAVNAFSDASKNLPKVTIEDIPKED